MIAGNIQRFGIEAEVDERIEGWVLGHIRFWLCGQPVGDWADSVDLRGCVRWLREFSQHPRDRYEAGLFELSASEVFERIFDPAMADGPHGVGIRDPYGRFHISHLGMSSLERFDVLLLADEHGAQRCLWRLAGQAEVADCRLTKGEMESVAAEFCARFDQGSDDGGGIRS